MSFVCIEFRKDRVSYNCMKLFLCMYVRVCVCDVAFLTARDCRMFHHHASRRAPKCALRDSEIIIIGDETERSIERFRAINCS